jgi:hypothetical protein
LPSMMMATCRLGACASDVGSGLKPGVGDMRK